MDRSRRRGQLQLMCCRLLPCRRHRASDPPPPPPTGSSGAACGSLPLARTAAARASSAALPVPSPAPLRIRYGRRLACSSGAACALPRSVVQLRLAHRCFSLTCRHHRRLRSAAAAASPARAVLGVDLFRRRVQPLLARRCCILPRRHHHRRFRSAPAATPWLKRCCVWVSSVGVRSLGSCVVARPPGPSLPPLQISHRRHHTGSSGAACGSPVSAHAASARASSAAPPVPSLPPLRIRHGRRLACSSGAVGDRLGQRRQLRLARRRFSLTCRHRRRFGSATAVASRMRAALRVDLLR